MKKTIKLSKYGKAIKTLSDFCTDFKIPNSSPEHARIIMSNIFRTAKSHVYQFSSNFDKNMYKADYVKELRRFLKRGGTFKIIFMENSPIDSSALNFLSEFQQKKPQSVYVGIATQEGLEAGKSSKGVGFFTTADNHMYRLSEICPPEPEYEFIATASFNDPHQSNLLEERWKKIESIPLKLSEYKKKNLLNRLIDKFSKV